MQQNLNTAYDSSGTLQKQADIYAESWEAAKDRVTAAAQNIYNALINDEFFINILDKVESFLVFVRNLIDNLGGLKGTLLTISSIVLQLFSSQIAQSMDTAIARIRDMTGITQKQALAQKEYALSLREAYVGKLEPGTNINSDPTSAISGNALNQGNRAYLDAQKTFIQNYSQMSDYERKIAQYQLDRMASVNQELEKLDKIVLDKEKILQATKEEQQIRVDSLRESNNISIQALQNDLGAIQTHQKGDSDNEKNIRNDIVENARAIINDPYASEELKKQAKELEAIAGNNRKSWNDIETAINKTVESLQKCNAKLADSQKEADALTKKYNNLKGQLQNQATQLGKFQGILSINDGKQIPSNAKDILNGFYDSELETGTAAIRDDDSEAIQTQKEAIQNLIKEYQEGEQTLQNWQELTVNLTKAQKDLVDLIEGEAEKARRDELEATGQLSTEEATATNQVKQETEAVRDNARILGEAAGQAYANGEAQKNMGKKFGDTTEKQIKLSAALTGFAQSVTAVAGFVNTLSNSIATLTDENANASQKLSALTALLMSFGTLLPTLGRLAEMKSAQVVTGQKAETTAIIETKMAAWEFYLIIAAIVVVVALLVVGIKALVNAYNKDAIAAEKAAESAKKLAEAYTEAKDSAQKLKDTISNYQTAKDELADLQQGTEEYTAKLIEANEQARKLIELAGGGGWFNASTGLYEFTDEELKAAQEAANRAVVKAQNNAITGQIVANSLTNISSHTDIMRSGQKAAESAAHAAGYTQNDDDAGVAFNSFVNEYKKSQNQWLDEAVKAIKSNGGDVSGAIAQANEKIGAQFEDDFTNIDSYLTGILENENKNLQLQKELINVELNQNSSDYQNSKDDIKDILNTSLAIQSQEFQYSRQELLDDYQDVLAKDAENRTLWQKDNTKLRVAYAAALGEDYYTEKSGRGVKIMHRNANGEDTEVYKNITDEQMEEFLTQQKALKDIQDKVSDSIETLENEITELNEIGIDRVKAIKLIASGQNGNIDLNNLNSKEISALYEGSEDEGYQNLIELGKATGQLKTDAEGNLISSYEELKAFEDRMWKARDSYLSLVQTVGQGLSSSVKGAYEEIIALGDYSKTEREQIAQTLTDAFKEGGVKGVEGVRKILSASDDPLGLSEALNEIDWKNTSLQNIQKQLKEAGFKIAIEDLETYKNLIDQIDKRHKFFTVGLDAILEEFKELREVINKIDYGTILSDEDFHNLPDALQDDYVRTPDGWMFIGDPKDLQKKANKAFDIDKFDDYYKQGREDIANAAAKDSQEYLKYYDDYINAYIFSSHGANINESGIFVYKGFNETAGIRAGINSDEDLQALLADWFSNDEETREYARTTIATYIDEIQKLAESDEFNVENQLTAQLLKAFVPIEDFDKEFDNLVEKYREGLEEAGVNIEELRKKALKANVKLTNDEDFDSLDKFKERVQKLSDDTLEEYTTELYKAEKAYKVLTEQVEEEGLNVDEWENYTDSLRKNNKELYNNAEAAALIALQNMRAQKGVDDLKSSYESYFESLKAEEGTFVHDQALRQLRANLEDMYGLTTGTLDDLDAEFWFKEQEIITAAMEGDEEAAMQLLQDMALASGITLEEWNSLKTQIESTPINGEFDITLTEKAKELLKNWGGAIEDSSGKLFNTGPAIPNRVKLPSADESSSGKSKTLKELDDEIDRYHYIRKLLADIERELERVDKAKDRAYGAQHLKYIEQETDYLREQVGLQDKYINEIEGYLAKDRGLIAAYGAQFDAAGNISNYNELFTSNFNKYANAEDSTNWENFKKALSQYEETLDLWFEQTEEKAELLRQILDKQLEGIQYKVDVKVELDDRELALLEYQLNRLDDAAYDTAEALSNIGSQFETVEDKIKVTTNGIVETLKTIPGITQAQIDAYLAGDGDVLAGLHIEQGQIDMLEDYSDQLLDLSNTLKDLHDNAIQKVSEAFDAWGEKIEDHIAKFQHLNTLIDNYQEIIGLLGRSNIGITNDFMREMRNQEIVNLQGILNTRTQVKDNLAIQLADARKQASEAATEAEREDWKQVADDIEQRLKEATESWQQAWIDALQANKEAFEAAMQDIVDSFDDYEDELKRYDTAQDRYLEPYRQAYELSKLTRDIDNSINDQDSIRAKKELQKLEDKIAQIKESGRAISENELDLLQKEYELRLAEIALEDAQNAKSLVRLTRNNEGNWGYTYIADQDKINEAQQNYEDKLYEYMRAADTMAEEASRTILTLNKEMAEALAALDANAIDYEAKVAEITQFYTDQINYFAEQYGISTDAINNVAKESAAKYKPEVVDIIESDNSGLQTNFDETVLAIIGDFEDLEDAINGPNGALPNIQRAYSETLVAFEDYREQNRITCERAGTDVSEMREKMEEEFSNIRTQTKETDGATKTMAEDMKNYLDQVLDSFGNFSNEYSAKVEIVSNANTVLAESIIKLEKALNNIDASSLDTLKKAADQVEAIAQQIKLAAAEGENTDGEISTTLTAAQKTALQALIQDLNQQILALQRQQAAISDDEDPSVQDLATQQNNARLIESLLQRKKEAQLRLAQGYNTGGYTGEWGLSGRLAILHEKELVLNKEDTANILDAVSLIRQMTIGTAQLSNGLGSIGAGLNNLNINPATMDQNVNISASFPNVQDRYEIEEAFNNLVNKASQYAFRENRYTPNYI